MSAATDIANQALGHLGVSTELADVAVDTSKEAIACRRYYDQCVEATLKAYPWDFATRSVALGLIAENPTSEWGFSYRYPTDALTVRRILSGARVDTTATRAPFRIVGDDSGKLIYTDVDSAVAEYTGRITSEGLWSEDFAEAVSYRLAWKMAPRLTAGDPYKLGAQAFALWQAAIQRAEINATEDAPDYDADSEFTRER